MSDACDRSRPTRRHLMQGAASLALWGALPGRSIAGTRDPRLLVVVLRGALDGLALAAPVGDPDYERLRGGLALPKAGAGAGLPLDATFALNPAMPTLHGLYQRREALVVHAVATPYRARSHFDGQDVLESGLPGVGRVRDGWLNRALAELPSAGSAAPQAGLAIGAVVPLVMRGRASVLTWSPKVYGLPLAHSTAARLMDLYATQDPTLAGAFAKGLEIDRVAEGMAAMASGGQPTGNMADAPSAAKAVGKPAPTMQQQPMPFRAFIETASTAARFLAKSDGPRIGALSFEGWDTHANEGVVSGGLANRLGGLDAAIKAFHDGMGPAWKDTVVVMVTEFGRTAASNGTAGTDHGTGTVALLLGGAVKGGRVLADWPGLSDKALYEGRDLAPTLDLRAVLKGLLKDHLGMPDRLLADAVFPDSGAVRAVADLVA